MNAFRSPEDAMKADGVEFHAFKPESRAGWLAQCQVDRQGELRGNLFNAVTALREDPALRDLLGFDEMLRAVILIKPVPSSGHALSGARPITDEDVSAIQLALQQRGLEKVSRDTAFQAVLMRARERSFHPVRDYLNGLRWDGKPRLATWLHTYLGAERNEYSAGIGSMFLIAMVARIFEPGCKADYMLVLEGKQSAMKSTACAVLGGQWFSDNLPSVGGDDVRLAQHLRGKWLIEVAEMSAMNKAETNDLKAFVSRKVEQFIPKYGRAEVHEPRQCLLIGTTNKAEYLRDETGGRRFWPVRVADALDVAALKRDRDQLFAEAVSLYRDGVEWWPSRDFEAEHIRAEQEDRFEADPWEPAVAEWLAHKDKVTAIEVLRGAVCLETGKIGQREQRRVSAILERLGWERRRTKAERWWVKGDRR